MHEKVMLAGNTATRHRTTNPQIWATPVKEEEIEGGNYLEASEEGSIVEVTVAGTDIYLEHYIGPDFGDLQVVIDGTTTVNINCYSASGVVASITSLATGLSGDFHIVTIENLSGNNRIISVLGDNSAGTGTAVSIVSDATQTLYQKILKAQDLQTVFTYSGGNIDTITYSALSVGSQQILETFSYSGSDVTGIVRSVI